MVLKHPYVTEKAMMALEKENKLQFLVDKGATKRSIKR
jgi:large subunit ribosomal protein L23